MPLREKKFLEKIKSGSFFDYVSCDFGKRENIRETFAKIPLIFNKIIVGRDDIGPPMKEYAEKDGLLTPARRMLLSSYFLQSGAVITPLLFFHLDLGLVCIKIFRFVQYTSIKGFDNFVQSAVNARREGDDSPHSSVVTGSMKLLANSSSGWFPEYGLESTYGKKCFNDKKTHRAILNIMSKRLGCMNDQLYEVEHIRSEWEHSKLIFVEFFFPQCAKLGILELYCNLIDKYFDVISFEELEMDTYLFYLAAKSRHDFCFCKVELFGRGRMYGWIFSHLNKIFRSSYVLRLA